MIQKKGFSLAELMVVMGIMGILAASAMLTFKPFDKGIKYIYSNTFHVLDRALYNAMSSYVEVDMQSRNPYLSKYKNDDGTEETLTHSNELDQGTERLCRALVEYINTIEGDAGCSSTKLVSDIASDDEFTNENVQFTAINGVRFWLSRRYPETPEDGKENFFIIYADINGKTRPNSMRYESSNGTTKDPDIFAFAALESGRICPLGIVEVQPRYLTTRITYEEVASSGSNDIALKYSKMSKPYIFSKAEAWGYYLPDSFVPTNETIVTDTEYIAGAPLTYNDYIRSKINSGSHIYDFLNKSDGTRKTMRDVFEEEYYRVPQGATSKCWTVNFRNNPPGTEPSRICRQADDPGYGCRWKSDQECEVTVDQYVN